MSFDARDLTITLYPGERGTEVLWGMACAGCATTAGGDEKPACQDPSQSPCQAPSNDADAWTKDFAGSLALLRREMKDTLGRA
jgi:hypothetical protein